MLLEGALPVAVHKTAIWSFLIVLDYLLKYGVAHTGQSFIIVSRWALLIDPDTNQTISS